MPTARVLADRGPMAMIRSHWRTTSRPWVARNKDTSKRTFRSSSRMNDCADGPWGSWRFLRMHHIPNADVADWMRRRSSPLARKAQKERTIASLSSHMLFSVGHARASGQEIRPSMYPNRPPGHKLKILRILFDHSGQRNDHMMVTSRVSHDLVE